MLRTRSIALHLALGLALWSQPTSTALAAGSAPPPADTQEDEEELPPGYDPDVETEDDADVVPTDPDVEPSDVGYDVEPPSGITYDEDAEPMDDEAHSDPKARPGSLPPHGLADRPTLPHIDVDLIHHRAGLVGQAAAQIDLTQLGEDLFVSLVLGTVFVGEDWAIAPRLPLRIRIVDAEPTSESIVREQDWDEASDFARLLAFFRYGHVGSRFYVRVGELNGATVGHGSIVNRYYNTADIDHYQGGVYTFFDTDFVGGEVLVDNLIDPELAVARGFVRPLSHFKALPFALEKLKLGASLGADLAAPVRVDSDPLTGEFILDDDFEAVVLESDVLPMMGVDVEIPILSTPHLDIVPYADMNTIDTLGVGTHVGAFVNVRFDPLTSLRTRAEYRYAGPDYEPGYVSPFYEIERLRHRDNRTKLDWLRSDALPEGRSGFYIESEYRMAGIMRYAVVFANDEGPDNADLLMRLQLPHLGPFKLSLFLARFDFDGADDIFDPQHTVAAINGRYNIEQAFFVRFSVMNEWWLSRTPAGTGIYETTTDYHIGGGLLLKL